MTRLRPHARPLPRRTVNSAGQCTASEENRGLQPCPRCSSAPQHLRFQSRTARRQRVERRGASKLAADRTGPELPALRWSG